MSWQGSQGEFFEESGEHNSPTEPLMPVIFSPSSTTIEDKALPVPIPHERPFPVQQPAESPLFPYRATPPATYPVLPPVSANTQGNKRPAGGGAFGGPNTSAQAMPAQPARSSLPLFVGVFFVAVQLLLLLRFALKLITLNGDLPWVGIIYAISGIFVLPFRLLLQALAVPLPTAFEIYTLLAIMMYGLLSRMLVRFLKALLHSR
ncbi:MAG: hypothetical protein NVSMB33_15170 [Ktedonobacteraceae bacterium]